MENTITAPTAAAVQQTPAIIQVTPENYLQLADQLQDRSYYRVLHGGKWRVGEFYKDQFFFPLSVNVWMQNCSAIVLDKIEMPS